jgi:hypothetical protein
MYKNATRIAQIAIVKASKKTLEEIFEIFVTTLGVTIASSIV